jgi:hypothetical protein
MAKRRKTAKRSGGTTRTIVKSSKPIIIRQSSAPVKHHRRRSGGGGGAIGAGKALLSSERLGALLGGFMLGVLDAKATKLPTIPVLGRAGTCGIALYYLGRHMKNPMVSHASTGFLAIAAYEMGKSGSISGADAVVGDSTMGDVDGVDTV